jgi:hypothetical protein
MLGTAATRFELLPDVVDFTIVLSLAGAGGLGATVAGALRGFGPERLGRLSLFGQTLGAGLGLAVLVTGLVLG